MNLYSPEAEDSIVDKPGHTKFLSRIDSIQNI